MSEPKTPQPDGKGSPIITEGPKDGENGEENGEEPPTPKDPHSPIIVEGPEDESKH